MAERAGSDDVLLLDYNGVIVDDEPIHFAVLRDLLAVERIALDEPTYLAHFLGRDDRACIGEAFHRAGRTLEPDAALTLAARKARWYAESVAGGVPVVPGVRRFVHEAAATMRIAVVSGALREEIRAGLAHAAVADLVECVIGAEDVVRGKPDPEGHRAALSRLAGPGGTVRAVVIEDSRPGLEAARALGAGSVMLTTGFGGVDAAEADLVWQSFDGHTPRDLEPFMREIAPDART